MNSMIHKSKQLLNSLAPAKVIQSRLHQRVMMNFAEKIGLVYFGYVDQRDDEHKLVRGATLSAGHRDNHYCIGTYGGYDMMLVERVDTIKPPHKPAQTYNWIIQAFDLKTHADIPHIFVGLQNYGEPFYAYLFTKFPTLARIPLGTHEGYGTSYLNRYSLYTAPVYSIEARQIVDASVAKVIEEHFGLLTFEIIDGTLYIYVEGQRPTQALLDNMTKCGTWLASVIDAKYTQQ